jgi:hypothetical protein
MVGCTVGQAQKVGPCGPNAPAGSGQVTERQLSDTATPARPAFSNGDPRLAAAGTGT